MSSTNRNNRQEINEKDYYVTPYNVVRSIVGELDRMGFIGGNVLDPAAGGNEESYLLNEYGMPYAEEIEKLTGNHVDTIDIRNNSKAEFKMDYLSIDADKWKRYDLIITNPPFSLAEEYVRKSMELLKEWGVLCLLLRLNFLEGLKRKELFDEFPPSYIFVHRKRMCFRGNAKYLKAGTDSIAYAHFVWIKGKKPEFGKIKIIDDEKN